MTRRPLHSVSTIYRIPLLIALISAVGLTSALLGDGMWDVLSWLALAVPVALAAIHWRRSRAKAWRSLHRHARHKDGYDGL